MSMRMARSLFALLLSLCVACDRLPALADETSHIESASSKELDAAALRDIDQARARGIFLSTTAPPEPGSAGATPRYGTVQR
jgi:hypothetical protein